MPQPVEKKAGSLRPVAKKPAVEREPSPVAPKADLFGIGGSAQQDLQNVVQECHKDAEPAVNAQVHAKSHVQAASTKPVYNPQKPQTARINQPKGGQ